MRIGWVALYFAVGQLQAQRPMIAGVDAGYVEPGACAKCHREIAETYARTGMAKSFGIARAIPEIEGKVFRHDASEEFFSTFARDGKTSLRRHQLEFDGTVGNVVEKQFDYWIGSGNHARSYLSRTASGELVELPLSWYAENGGHWGMSPGYDRPDHAGFSRKITTQCLFCHNAYPEIEPGADNWDRTLRPGSRLPEGIDCQRCHGPGRDHINAVTADAARRAVVNPARLAPDRQMEVCLQCHLETTNLRLPASLIRYGRGVFSYRPGEPLENYILHFDHAAGAGYDDKFEFSSAPYRLRKSACFLASKGTLTCTTCHNPHDASKASSVACRNCHSTKLAVRIRERLHPESNDCVSCHMPQRRPSDAIHVTITDHYIRKRPAGDPPGPVVELHDNNTPPYRGEVVLYYPASLPETPAKELYLAVAQVKNQANLRAGLQRLETAIAKYAPKRSEFYFDLAEAFRHAGRLDKAAAFYEEAASRPLADWRPLYGLGITLAAAGDPARSELTLKRAVSLAPRETASIQALAKTLFQGSKVGEGLSVLQSASALEPESAEIRNDLGTALFRLGEVSAAEKALREAVRLRPEIAAMHLNLAEVLSRRGAFPEAKHHFEAALRIDSSSAEAHSAFGTALVANGRLKEARAQYEAALRINPQLPVTRNNMGALLLKLGDVEGAIRQYRLAIAARPDAPTSHYNLAIALAGQGRVAEAEQSLKDAVQYAPNYFEAHLKLGQILMTRGETALAAPHLRKALESPDPQVRNAANDALGIVDPQIHR